MVSWENLCQSLRARVFGVDSQWVALSDVGRESQLARARFASMVDELNSLACQLQELSWPETIPGVYRDGARTGEEWGFWRLAPHFGELHLVDSLPARLDAEPFVGAAAARVKLNGDYLRVHLPEGFPRWLHRQWWSDFHDVCLPSWIQVDHGEGGKGDNRLLNLRLLPFWLNVRGPSVTGQGPSPRSEATLPSRKRTAAASSGGARSSGVQGEGSLLKRRRR